LLIDMIAGVRAIHAPIEFALGWIPFLMAAWCATCITMYAVAFGWTFLLTGRKPQASQLLSAAAGLALGLATIHAHFHPAWWPLSIIALWPLLVRRDRGPGLDPAPLSGVDAAQLDAAADESRDHATARSSPSRAPRR